MKVVFSIDEKVIIRMALNELLNSEKKDFKKCKENCFSELMSIIEKNIEIIQSAINKINS